MDAWNCFSFLPESQLQAQNDLMALLARKEMSFVSTEDEIKIIAKKKLTLNGGGSYITMDGDAIELATLGDFRTRAGYYDRQAQTQNKHKIPALSEIILDPSQEEITESYILLDDGENPIESYRYRLGDCKSELFGSAGTSEVISGEDKNITFWLSVDRAERS